MGECLLARASPAVVVTMAILAGAACADEEGLIGGKVIRLGHDIPDAVYLSQHAEEMERSGVDGRVIEFTPIWLAAGKPQAREKG